MRIVGGDRGQESMYVHTHTTSGIYILMIQGWDAYFIHPSALKYKNTIFAMVNPTWEKSNVV